MPMQESYTHRDQLEIWLISNVLRPRPPLKRDSPQERFRYEAWHQGMHKQREKGAVRLGTMTCGTRDINHPNPEDSVKQSCPHVIQGQRHPLFFSTPAALSRNTTWPQGRDGAST